MTIQSTFDIIILVFVLALSISIHEFFHGYIAFLLGDPTAKLSGRLTLNPLAHIDPFMTVLLPLILIVIGSPIIFAAAKPVPFNPHFLRTKRWGPALVALAGPFSNFLLVLASFLPLKVLTTLGVQSLGLVLALKFFTLMIFINLILMIINLVPIPPLDGSKILYSLLPSELAYSIMRIEQFGIFFFLIFLLLFGRYLFSLIFYFANIFIPQGLLF